MSLVALEKIPTFNHIITNLYLGDINSTQVKCLESNNIKIVVNISNTSYEKIDGITYYDFNIDDDSNEDILQFFESFYNIVSNAETNNLNVLVHCMNSVSRSVTLTLSYLLKKSMTLCQAFQYLKSKRTQYTKPNTGFTKQLISYESKLFGCTTMKTIDFFKK
jgi:protein-tyrosine phosphatase